MRERLNPFKNEDSREADWKCGAMKKKLENVPHMATVVVER
jgi:hypothetical protein